jgi:hypothetical protein
VRGGELFLKVIDLGHIDIGRDEVLLVEGGFGNDGRSGFRWLSAHDSIQYIHRNVMVKKRDEVMFVERTAYKGDPMDHCSRCPSEMTDSTDKLANLLLMAQAGISRLAIARDRP